MYINIDGNKTRLHDRIITLILDVLYHRISLVDYMIIVQLSRDIGVLIITKKVGDYYISTILNARDDDLKLVSVRSKSLEMTDDIEPIEPTEVHEILSDILSNFMGDKNDS